MGFFNFGKKAISKKTAAARETLGRTLACALILTCNGYTAPVAPDRHRTADIRLC